MAKRGSIFQSIPVGRIGRSNFNLSHQLTGNFKEGICYPVFCEETLPGDSWRINTYNISKLETLLAPAMQRTNASLLWFKIPKRLCMKNFKKWYSGGKDGNSTVAKPTFKLRSFAEWLRTIMNSSLGRTADDVKELTDFFFGPGSVWQMVGLPIPYYPDSSTDTVVFSPPVVKSQTTSLWEIVWSDEVLDQSIDLIPFIAYAKLYDEYFCDQTLSQHVFIEDEDFSNFNSSWRKTVKTANGNWQFNGSSLNVYDGGEFSFIQIVPLFCLFRRAWQKEYFTSAMPTAQRGPEVQISLVEGTAPVTIPTDQEVSIDTPVFSTDYEGVETRMLEGNVSFMDAAQRSSYMIDDDSSRVDHIRGTVGNELSGSVDLSGLSPISIVAFRNLFKLQAFLEKNNVAGGRFIEFILAHWAERVPDFTVQRPVFVRATQIPVVVSEVTATANSEGLNSQVGDQAGRAKGQGNLGRCRIYTQEPSIIIGIYCVTPPPSYVTQGIPRKFQRFTRWDEPYTEFQHIGEQAILNKEIFVDFQNSQSELESEFGYQQRYSEFKYLPDRVVGEFATNLAYWHQARMFASQPYLNQAFIECDPSDRIFAVQNQNPVLADFWFDIKCSRKLSKFSTPKLN